MPNPTVVPITQPRVPFLNPDTGFVSREWYMFLLSLNQLTSGSNVSLGDLQKGPPTLTVDEVNVIIDRAMGSIDPSQDGLLAQIAELQKRIDALESAAAQPQLGTMAPMNKEFMDYIGWNQNAGVVVQPGQMAWNPNDGTLDIGMGYDAVTQQVGLETYFRIKAGSTIADGDLIMFAGAVGASGVIIGEPASTSLSEGLRVMGVATMDIPANDFGYVTAFGLVRGIDTTGTSVGETWVDGDILYYNPAYVGRMTNVRPTSPNEVVVVAAVVNAGPGGSGSLFVRSSFYPNLGELSNVYAPTPADGDKLIYNAANGRWEKDSRSYLMLE